MLCNTTELTETLHRFHLTLPGARPLVDPWQPGEVAVLPLLGACGVEHVVPPGSPGAPVVAVLVPLPSGVAGGLAALLLLTGVCRTGREGRAHISPFARTFVSRPRSHEHRSSRKSNVGKQVVFMWIQLEL